MHKIRTKYFRSVLRVLERELGFQTDLGSQCCGVSLAQCHILMEFAEKKETSIKELSETFGVDKSSLSRTVDKMVALGLLNRVENKNDRRYLSLSLTKKGNQMADNINRTCSDYYAELFKNIPEDKHSAIIDSLSLLAEAMNKLRKGKNGSPKSCCI
ncbi:MAG: MarR family winged helix-turn-helix transcriptional regulator [bacterium]